MYYFRIYTLIIISFASLSAVCKPLTTLELADLLIQQKDYHSDGRVGEKAKLFESSIEEIYREESVSVGYEFVPSSDGLAAPMPVVVFKPQSASAERPAPVIIHVHGGPHVHVTPETKHAEIAYFLSHGYVVVAPNYRGSSLPSREAYEQLSPRQYDELERLQYLPKGLEPVCGPQDVYAAAKFALSRPYSKQDGVYLRGCSFGSHINAHFLAEQSRGAYKDLAILGVHLSAGPDYPKGHSLNCSTPILLTHGVEDTIVPIAGSQNFLSELSLTKVPHCVATFFSGADHHCIDPSLKRDSDRSSEGYRNLYRYAVLLSQQMGIATRDEMVSASSLELPKNINVEAALPKEFIYCPTNAHLRLVLGNEFSGDAESDLRNFYLNYFNPVLHEAPWAVVSFEGVGSLGSRLVENARVFTQLVEMLKTEQAEFEKNPKQFVFYHAASNQTVSLFTFFSAWHNALLGKSDSRDLHGMRAFTSQASSFENIDKFLKHYGSRYTEKIDFSEIFNNQGGFAPRALAVDPWLTFKQNTASCSAWWYHQSPKNQAPLEEIRAFCASIGLSSDQAQKYLDLFEELATPDNVMMQQIFVSKEGAEEYGYFCEHWGNELKGAAVEADISRLTSLSPSLGKDFIDFELLLRKNSHRFDYPEISAYASRRLPYGTHHSEALKIRRHCKDFTGGMQVRLLLHPRLTENMKVKSYFKNGDAQAAQQARVLELVREDIASINKKQALDGLAFYGMQRALLSSEAREPDTAEFLRVNKELPLSLKQSIHTSVRSEKRSRSESIFALSEHVLGYTYFDILMEALENRRKQIAAPSAFQHDLQDYERIVKEQDSELLEFFFKTMASPKMCTERMPAAMYHRVYSLLRTLKWSFSDARHAFASDRIPSDANHDFRAAQGLVKNIALQAKEKSYRCLTKGRSGQWPPAETAIEEFWRRNREVVHEVATATPVVPVVE